MKSELEDGLYQARDGHLQKLDLEDDGTKKLRVTQEPFEAVVKVQRRMRKELGGNKPDIGLVAAAMLLAAAEMEGIEEKVKEYAISVFSGRQPLQNSNVAE